jgi:hypothetical protein
MGFFDTLMGTFLDDPDRKEKRFEESVMKKFPRKYFDIVKQPSAKTDQERSSGRLHDPPYVLVHKPTKEEFAIECAYFPKMYPQEILEFCTPDQFEHVKKYRETRKLPVFFLIGLGGVDNFGNEALFIVPLTSVEKPVLSPDIFETYRKMPHNDFFWDRGQLY